MDKELTERIDANYRAIAALTDQVAQLVRERDDLQKQVWLYEKNGVTCQTYRHTVKQSCSECNVQMDYNTTPPQPEQEPVAWANLNELSEQIKRVNCGTVYGQPPELIRFGWQSVYGQPPEAQGSQPLYTTPPQRKPLTDEQLIAAYESEQRGRYGDHIRSLRAIEAAHGIKEREKNT